ncbi:HupE/UreJ family protein [Pseudohongiella sp.]|uniref:HupE/UreJ family protein n=1 Tax=marine sediment metagenome TaxID=412755 RepID=A0A0F9QX14_9ZZZZ|nr:HupE/UreJ family protein [Pseudohongiella sp.]HDZ08249.1 HupE/UreJ family protein [Pseudohongiella sp.]HEA63689.1 HupE/UreJ family protein [Pseudohongiella sp.]
MPNNKKSVWTALGAIRVCLVVVFLLAATGMPNALADEIPTRVAVQGFVKAEPNRLNVLMRIPMDSLGEAGLPLRGSVGYLIFSEAQEELEDAASDRILRSIQMFEGDRLLDNPRLDALRVSLPSNRSFVDYQSALANVRSAPLSDDVDLYYRQGFMDVLVSYPIDSAEARFSIDARLGGLGLETTTVLRYILDDGSERTFSYIGNPGRVYLDPSWHQAVFNFIALGFDHILEGADHLLFLFCLLIPLRRVGALIPVVTSFTIAHSITLLASALGWVPSAIWFPSLIETLIALSIVYMAFENIVGVKQRHRWVVTFCFGLVHGFGFSFLLTESMQFAGSHLVMSLLAFNLGVEFGQILVLVLMVPFIHLLFKYALPERIGVILLSAIVAHWAWHWMAERFVGFMAYDLSLPTLDRYFFAGLLQWGALLALSAGVLWLMQELFARYFAAPDDAGRVG